MPQTHPMQPLVIDDQGVVRFKQNKIVRALLDTGKLNMNEPMATYFHVAPRHER